MKKLFLLFLCLFVGDSFASGIGNVSSAPCDNDTLNKYTGTANVEINWEPNTIGLKWFNGDQQIAGPTSCVYDGTITVPPAPTKLGYTFNGWKVQKTTPPDNFTELEYIEGGTTLNAYLDLGFPATPTMQTLLKASIVDRGVYERETVIFGSSDTESFLTGKPYSIDVFPSYVYVVNGNYSSSVSMINIQILLDTIYEYKINYPTIGIIGIDNNTKTGFTNLDSISSQNLYVFNYTDHYVNSTVGRMKLYNLKLWDNGELMHNYIPVKRNSDNTLGVYDMITGAFLTNAGTGSFVAGPAVQ